MQRRSRMWCGVWPAALAGALAACGDGGTNPVLPACTTGTSFGITLAAGQYVSVDPAANGGCVAFAANQGAQAVEYLVVPQSTTGTAGRTTTFALAGEPATAAALSALRVGGPAALSTPDRFHEFLRRTEQDGYVDVPASTRDAGASALRMDVAAGPPVEGELRQFSVCAKTDCSVFQTVTAVAERVGQRLAIFVDTLAPAGGLDAFDPHIGRQALVWGLELGDFGVDGSRNDLSRNALPRSKRSFEPNTEPAAEFLGVADGTPYALQRRS